MTVEELCMTGDESLNVWSNGQTGEFVTPIMPPVQHHPGLKALWKEQENREFYFDFKQSLEELQNV